MIQRKSFYLGGLVLIGQLAWADSGQNGEEKPAPEKRAFVGRTFSPIGTVLARDKGKKDWKFPALYDEVYAGAQLLALPGARGIVNLQEGDVRLTLAGNLPELSPSPVLESAGVLHAGKDFDLDMTLERGRVAIENLRKQGPVKARFRLPGGNLDVVLANPGTTIILELFSRWLPGTSFSIKPRKGLEPVTNLVLLIVKGKAEVEFKAEKHALEGPVVFHWSSHLGARGPVALKELPKWIKPGADTSARAAAWHAAVEHLRRLMAEKKSLGAALAAGIKNPDPFKRSVAVYSAAATGELGLVLAGLNDGKSAEVRRSAIQALEHEIGHGQAADGRVYETLIAINKLTAGQGEIAMQLLHGFAGPDLLRPETYETLIAYLQHKKLPIRELAAWNLYRLVPQGKGIAYDAAAASEERGRSQAAWRKLIPEGKLPLPK